LWRVNPEVHGDQMAKIWWMRALLCLGLQEPSTDACALARRAFAAAYDPGLKQGIQQLIDRLCVDSQG
jgi:hypothetical protein